MKSLWSFPASSDGRLTWESIWTGAIVMRVRAEGSEERLGLAATRGCEEMTPT